MKSKEIYNLIIRVIEVTLFFIMFVNIKFINSILEINFGIFSLILYVVPLSVLEFLRTKLVGIQEEKINLNITGDDLIKLLTKFFEENHYNEVKSSFDNISIYEKCNEKGIMNYKYVIYDALANEEYDFELKQVIDNIRNEINSHPNKIFNIYLILLTNRIDDNIMEFLSNNIFINPVHFTGLGSSSDLGNFIIPCAFDVKEQCICFGKIYKSLSFYKNKKEDLLDILYYLQYHMYNQ